jgi:hypothetical protein
MTKEVKTIQKNFDKAAQKAEQKKSQELVEEVVKLARHDFRREVAYAIGSLIAAANKTPDQAHLWNVGDLHSGYDDVFIGIEKVESVTTASVEQEQGMYAFLMKGKAAEEISNLSEVSKSAEEFLTEITTKLVN